MEALRNYSQHRAYPVGDVRLGSNNIGEEEAQISEYNIIPTISVNSLKRDKSFKSSVLAELAIHEDTIDLKPLVREYIDGLGKIHQNFRGRAVAAISSAVEQIELTKEYYYIRNNISYSRGEMTFLSVVDTEKLDSVDENRLLSSNQDIINHFLKKNRNVQNISARYLSSK